MSNRLASDDDPGPHVVRDPINGAGKQSKRRSHPISGIGRIWMAISAAVLPSLALIFSAGGSPLVLSAWQSGRVDQYAGLLLAWPGYGPFLPLTAFSMVALLLWLFRDRMIDKFLVRLGIYTGAILTLHFLLLVIAAGGVGFLLSAAIYGPIQWGILFLIAYMFRNVRRFGIRHLLVATTVSAVLISLGKLLYTELNLLGFLGGVLILGAASSPVLSAITMFRGSVAAVKTGQACWREKSSAAVLEVSLGWTGW